MSTETSNQIDRTNLNEMFGEESSDSSIMVARQEFTNHLYHYLIPLIHEGFVEMYGRAKTLCGEDSERKRFVLKEFQLEMKKIPNWNASVLEAHTERIKSRCNFIMKIVTVIFTSYVKILSSARIRGRNKNIKIKIPMQDIFIHSVYTNCAKLVFKEPHLFKDDIPHAQKYENRRRVEIMFREAIQTSLNSFIPLENILHEYIGNLYDEEIEDEVVQMKTVSPNAVNAVVSETETSPPQTNPSPPTISGGLPNIPLPPLKPQANSDEESDSDPSDSEEIMTIGNSQNEGTPQTSIETKRIFDNSDNESEQDSDDDQDILDDAEI